MVLLASVSLGITKSQQLGLPAKGLMDDLRVAPTTGCCLMMASQDTDSDLFRKTFGGSAGFESIELPAGFYYVDFGFHKANYQDPSEASGRAAVSNMRVVAAGSDPDPEPEILLGDVNNSGKVIIVDAQIVYDLATSSVYGERWSAYPYPKGWTMKTLFTVANVNKGDDVDSGDALAIRYYVHYGKFGSK